MEEILRLPIDEQAKYADHICGAFAHDLTFCKQQLDTLGDNPRYERWNATSIGNCAYMALHGCPETRAEYASVLERGARYFKDKQSLKEICLFM